MALEAPAAARVEARLAHLRSHRDHMVIDGDVHPTPFADLPPDIQERIRSDPNYYHGRPFLAEDLVATFDRAEVDMALCWQNPAVLTYTEDEGENFRRLLAANRAIADLAGEHPTRVIPGGWTDPKALGLDNARELARICVEALGMPIVKMNPAQNAYPIDDPMVLATVDRIVELGAVPAFHFGADSPYTPPAGLEAVAARRPDHPVIGVHMGGGGGHFVEADPIYVEARALGLRRPNVFYILSAIRDPHIESNLITYAMAGEPFSRNIVTGSDAPYGNMVWNFGGFRALFAALRDGASHGDPRLAERPDLFDDDLVTGFTGRNLADLVIAADRRLLGPAASEHAAG